ncbi:DNA-binding protein YbiB, partial [Klebsiella pneumoniae]|nr:DNA-binding protein YbiB [Klebsiella pneumoniae]
GFPVVVHGLSHAPTRVLTETILSLLDIPATLHAGQPQAQLEGHEPVYITVGAVCQTLEKHLAMRGRMGVRNSAKTL